MTPRLPFLLLAVLSLALAGCTSPEEAENPTPTSPTPGGTQPTQTTPAMTTPTTGGTGGTNNTGGNGTSPAGRSLVNESFESGLVAWRNQTDVASGAGDWSFSVSTNESHGGQSSLRIAFAGGEPNGAAWIAREVQTPGGNAGANGTGGATNGTGGATNGTGGATNGTGGASQGMMLNLSVWVRAASDAASNVTGGTNTGLGNDSAAPYVLLWIGTTEPTAGDEFDAANGATAHSGVRIALRQQESGGVGGTGVGGTSDGWQLYSLEWATPVPANGLLYVAVGIFVEGEGGSTAVPSGSAEFFVDDLMLEFDSVS